jgi:hypothetical protein
LTAADLQYQQQSTASAVRRYAGPIVEQPTLIIQVPRGSAIESQLRNEPPQGFTGDHVLVQVGPTDEQGNLEAMAGEVVLSVPAPEGLERQSESLQRVLRQAGTGTAPLVVVVEAGERIEDQQAASLAAAALHAPRTVILRVIRPSER